MPEEYRYDYLMMKELRVKKKGQSSFPLDMGVDQEETDFRG